VASVSQPATQLALVNKLLASEENTEEADEHSLIVLTQSKLSAWKVSGGELRVSWEKDLERGKYSMEVSECICLSVDNRVTAT
jgi:hypothetical protein